MWWSIQVMKLLIMHPPATSSLLGPKILQGKGKAVPVLFF
jgi:hypothetical protein